MKSYWVVWAEGGGSPTVRHDSRRDAEREAERLARQHRNQRFAVLECVAAVSVSDVHWEQAELEEPPF